MKLGELLQAVPSSEIGADRDTWITSLAYDSRRAKQGSLFFAIHGEKADGHDFIPQALERGAVAIVSARPAPLGLSGHWIRVPTIRRALSAAARVFFGHPDSRLKLIGVTGTNGKTTTAYLLDSILRSAGTRTGLFGTIEYRLGKRILSAVNTTPESLDMLSYFAELVEAGGEAAIMEVSSHALAQERVWEFPFRAAVFTNLTRDHLDYHKDFEHYFEAKRRLFEGLGAPPPVLAVVNVDDPWGKRLLDLPHPRRVTYAINADAEVKVTQVHQSDSGIEATLLTPTSTFEVSSPLMGRANLENILAAAATAFGLEVPLAMIAEGIAGLKAVPGRFELVDEGQPCLVVVDYAHTDDALRNVLKTARDIARGRLIALFGCGGERDRTKRPLMGEAAGSLSDFVVLTSDNPRGEDPILIMNDALVGLQRTGKPYVAEVDRGVAIRTALEQAQRGDVVVLAGKGHETYQVLKDGPVPFDDREVARKLLRAMGFRRATSNVRRPKAARK